MIIFDHNIINDIIIVIIKAPTTTSENLIYGRLLFLHLQFSVTAFDVRVHGSDFSPDSRYLVFVGPSGLPIALYSHSCFTLRFSPLLSTWEFSSSETLVWCTAPLVLIPPLRCHCLIG